MRKVASILQILAGVTLAAAGVLALVEACARRSIRA